jgi:predicted ATP-grasp superfamily ATP-dependent carboligase
MAATVGNGLVELGGKRVLVTDAGSTKALAIVRALGRAMEVWTASESRLDLARWSRYSSRHLVYPFDKPRELVPWLLSTCRNHGIQVVLCPEGQSSFLVSRARDLFNVAGVQVAVPPAAALEQVMDKAATIAAAATVGIPVPRTRVLADLDDLIPAARDLGYPVVVKPRFSDYWDGSRFLVSHGVGYARSDDDLRVALRRVQPPSFPPPLLQEFVPGDGVGFSAVMSPDGTTCAEFAHERLRDLRPTGSGSVLRRSVAIAPQLREWSLALLRSLRWSSVAMVEFRRDSRTGTSYLMEVNGRFWGSVQLAIDAGVNFPEILVRNALGEQSPAPPYRDGVVVRWWLGDVVRTWRVLRGPPPGFPGRFPSRGSALRSLLGRQPPETRNEVLRRDDPWPAVGEMLGLFGRTFRLR